MATPKKKGQAFHFTCDEGGKFRWEQKNTIVWSPLEALFWGVWDPLLGPSISQEVFFFIRALPEIMRGHPECVRELIQGKADVNAWHTVQCTPLHMAVKQDENLMSKKRHHHLCKRLHFDFNLTLRDQYPGKFFFRVRPPLSQCGGDAS